MKKLYALLIILIVIYIGINVGANGLNILNSNDNATTATTTSVDMTNDITVGASSFPKLDNFTEKKINDSAVKLVDNKTGVNIEVEQISNSTDLSELYNNLVSDETYTSTQEIDQNGVTAYFLYQEGADSYDTDIYFAKNNQNYKITGHNTTYENSDYFINSCKNIIDTLNATSGNDGKISRF